MHIESILNIFSVEMPKKRFPEVVMVAEAAVVR